MAFYPQSLILQWIHSSTSNNWVGLLDRFTSFHRNLHKKWKNQNSEKHRMASLRGHGSSWSLKIPWAPNKNLCKGPENPMWWIWRCPTNVLSEHIRLYKLHIRTFPAPNLHADLRKFWHQKVERAEHYLIRGVGCSRLVEWNGCKGKQRKKPTFQMSFTQTKKKKNMGYFVSFLSIPKIFGQLKAGIPCIGYLPIQE